MTQEELQNKIAEYYVKLPENLQEVFSSMKWMEEIKNISTKYNLNDEQTQNILTETTMVLLCIIELGEYVEEIRKTLANMPKEKSDELLVEIDNLILKDIKENLDNSYLNNIEDMAEKYNKISTDIPLPPYRKDAEKQTTKEEILPTKNYMEVFDLKKEQIQQKVIQKNENLKNEKPVDALSRAGIEMIQEEKIEDKNTLLGKENIPELEEKKSLNESGIEVVKEKIQTEENKNEITEKEKEIIEDSGINMLEHKFNNSTISPKIVNDYTKDPYKEPLE